MVMLCEIWYALLTSNQTPVSLSSSEWKTCRPTEVHWSPRGLANALVSDLTEHPVAADVVGLQDTSDMKQNEALWCQQKWITKQGAAAAAKWPSHECRSQPASQMITRLSPVQSKGLAQEMNWNFPVPMMRETTLTKWINWRERVRERESKREREREREQEKEWERESKRENERESERASKRMIHPTRSKLWR